MLPYALAVGALVAVIGALVLFALGGLNLAYAAGGDAESPGLNAAFGALFIVAGLALLVAGAIAGWFAMRMRRQA
ncbi:MAG TPA: hypothetical protein VFH62_03970 [Dehalococcoidia bacterium]|nr:hypothetical protein [Dehalococcoidia bacterium]